METARLRSGPDESKQLVGLLDAGRPARVLDRRKGWARVRLQSGTEGWVRADLLKVSLKAKAHAYEVKQEKARQLAAAKAAKEKRLAEARAKNLAAAQAAKAKRVAAAQAAQAARAEKLAAAAAAAKAKRLAAARVRAQQIAAVRAQASAAKKLALAQAEAVVTALKRAAAVAAPQAAVAPASGERPVRAVHLQLAALPAAGGPHGGPILEPAEPRTPAEKTTRVAVAELPATPRAAVAPADPAPVAPEPVLPAAPAPAKIAAPALAKPPAPTPAPKPTRSERLVRAALSYRGTPYRFGARGERAFDCSGFTWYLWRRAGAPLPRTAAQQYRRGVRVAKSDMQPGDLVFFKNTYKRGVSHVGVYVGDGQFVHASSGGRQVRVDSLSQSYYVRHWAGARRMVSLAKK